MLFQAHRDYGTGKSDIQVRLCLSWPCLPWRRVQVSIHERGARNGLFVLFWTFSRRLTHCASASCRTSSLQAKVLYLTAVQQYPLYGATFFDAQYKGFWSFPNRLFICVDVSGFKFVNLKTKDIMAEFLYDQLKNFEVNSAESSITFNMTVALADESPSYMFSCPRTDDVAQLIASYSPAHRNWKQVCACVRVCVPVCCCVGATDRVN